MTTFDPDSRDRLHELIDEIMTTVKGRQDFAQYLHSARGADFGAVTLHFKGGVFQKAELRTTEYANEKCDEYHSRLVD